MSKAILVGLTGLLVGGPGFAVFSVAVVLPVAAVYAFLAAPLPALRSGA